MLRTKLLESIALEGQPCCIASCPEVPEVFVIGTYDFKEGESGGPSTKSGKLFVYDLFSGNLYVTSSYMSLIGHQIDADCIDDMLRPFPSLTASSICDLILVSPKSLASLQAWVP